ncbi:MAG: DNA repair exonuclease [archaeon]
MRIAITSDFHLGYQFDAPRGEDSFRQAEEALQLASGADLIILAGDIFDSRTPRQEVTARALRMFEKIDTPIIAVWGTHERRIKEYVNPVQVIEHAAFLKCLHCSASEHHIDGRSVKVYGMSGVPDRYAKVVLDKWNPKPDGDINILVIHQSLKEYIYNPYEPAALELSDLPKGFDLVVCGHIHWSDLKTGKPHILCPGSTIRTQLKSAETEPKRVWFYEPPEKFESVPLKTQREFFYKILKFDGASPSEVVREAKEYIESASKSGCLMKLKLTGSLCKGYSPSDVDVAQLHRAAAKGAFLSVSNELAGQKAKAEKREASQRPIREQGIELLESYLGEDPDEIFQLLLDGKLEDAGKRIVGESFIS